MAVSPIQTPSFVYMDSRRPFDFLVKTEYQKPMADYDITTYSYLQQSNRFFCRKLTPYHFIFIS